MSQELRTTTLSPAIVEKLVLDGDLSGLNATQRIEFYNYRCNQAQLDPAAKPFDLLKLNGKLVLYANAACTQQLTANRKLSHQVTNRELVDGIYCVFVKVTDSEGRSTENMGAVPVEGLKGEAKANAMLKATTKAIRRAVLAHCGLGMLDETEVDTIPGAARVETLIPEPILEWTDEERSAAYDMLAGYADELMDKGLGEAQIQEIIGKPKSTIGDSCGFEKWSNRFAQYCQRQDKKLEAAV